MNYDDINRLRDVGRALIAADAAAKAAICNARLSIKDATLLAEEIEANAEREAMYRLEGIPAPCPEILRAWAVMCRMIREDFPALDLSCEAEGWLTDAARQRRVDAERISEWCAERRAA